MKRFIALAMSTLMLTSSVSAADNGSASPWAEDAIVKAYRYGIAETDMFDSFRENVTRRQFCALCANLIRQWDGDDLSTKDVSFGDVSDEDEDIILCAGLGIVNGTGDGLFEPNRLVTRQEAAVMLYNTIDKLTGTLDNLRTSSNKVDSVFLPHIFGDGEEIMAWARDEVYAMYHMGVLQGDEKNNFNPTDNFTAEQAIAAFVRLYEAKDKDVFQNVEIYPGAELGQYFVNHGGETYLELPFNYNEVKSLFNPYYTDAYGNTYTAEDMGYIYPFDRQYMFTYMGLGERAVMSKDGSIFMPNDVRLSGIYKTDGDIAVLRVVRSETNYGGYDYNGIGYKVFNLKTGKEIELGSGIEYIYPVGEDMYFAEWGSTGSAGCFIDSDFNIITDYKYRISHSTFMNGLCVARKFDGGYEIVNTEGETVKTLNIDDDKYTFDSAYGTNIILRDNSTGKYAVENTEKNSMITGFDNARFISDGRINAEKNGFTYVYSADGSLELDGSALGYTTLTAYDYIDDVYTAAKADGSLEIVNKNGEVIYSGVYGTSLEYDGGGVYCARSSENELVTFDRYGNVLGRFSSEGEAQNYGFVNGLISIPVGDGVDYYTSTGDKVGNLSK